MKRFLTSASACLVRFSRPSLSTAASVENPSFWHTWARTVAAVAAHTVSRTWMWGPSASSDLLLEPYAEALGGQRLAQYFDKTRMALTHPDADEASLWYVTNGLLAKEGVTGQLQLSDATFEVQSPPQVNLAGDPDDPTAPTYASLRALLDYRPIPVGCNVIQTVDRGGHVGAEARLAGYQVPAKDVGALTLHTVASALWAFMTSSALYGGAAAGPDGPAVSHPVLRDGLPLDRGLLDRGAGGRGGQAGAGAGVRAAGAELYRGQPGRLQVEAGDVGLHHSQWRYRPQGGDARPGRRRHRRRLRRLLEPRRAPVLLREPGRLADERRGRLGQQ